MNEEKYQAIIKMFETWSKHHREDHERSRGSTYENFNRGYALAAEHALARLKDYPTFVLFSSAEVKLDEKQTTSRT